MSSTSDRRAYEDSGRWEAAYGVELFAGLMLALLGVLHVLRGIVAIRGETLGTIADTVGFDLTAWGWITLVIGVGQAVAAVGILLRHDWGRLAGLLIAFVSALGSFGFMPAYPFWGVVLLAFDVLVIWALLTQLYYEGE